MAKLQDMFTQARRAQSGGAMGFLGKKAESKAHSAALVVAFPSISAGNAESALKAGADGLLFSWDGRDSSALTTLKAEVEAAKANNANAVVGVRLTSAANKLQREMLTQLKENGAQFVLLPFNAPLRLLSLENKDFEKVVSVPVRQGELYPLLVRGLSGFEHIAAILLEFESGSHIGTLSIEDALHLQTVREAVRFPAFTFVEDDLTEDDAHVLKSLGIQGVILNAAKTEEATREQVKTVRAVLEKVHQEEQEQDLSSPSIRR